MAVFRPFKEERRTLPVGFLHSRSALSLQARVALGGGGGGLGGVERGGGGGGGFSSFC